MTHPRPTANMATVLEILRTSHDENPEDIAALLSMTKTEYEKLEYGEAPLTHDQAVMLGHYYKVNPRDLERLTEVMNYNSGLQSRTIMYVTNYYEGWPPPT